MHRVKPLLTFPTYTVTVLTDMTLLGVSYDIDTTLSQYIICVTSYGMSKIM